MKQIDFYFDFISPYAYLAFEHLPEVLMGHSYSVRYKPVLFAALLHQHGQLGPAEIAPKRDWTYRQVAWLARQHAIDFQLPSAHPFNPLALLRLALACGGLDDLPNRFATETIFHHVWRGGLDAADPQRLQSLTAHLAPARDPAEADVKTRLKSLTDEAVALGLFGVPTLVVDGRLFWGFDALPMLRDYLAGDAWFNGPQWEAAAVLPVGIRRQGRHIGQDEKIA